MSAAPLRVVIVPSVTGGIGHISRSAALARALQRLDPGVEVEFVLDTERLRPFNIDAAMQMGFRPRLMPPRTRESRDGIVRACFGDPDVVVDDVCRYLLPLRQVLPAAGWISILMHPIVDELFLDWPFMAQMDALIWPYAPLVGFPAELASMADKICRTGPFLEIDDVPPRADARRQLGLRETGKAVVYAPRGFPFGPDFGHRVLASLYEAVAALRSGDRYPDLKLLLLAVKDRAELRAAGLPETLPDWVRVEGVVPAARSLLYARAADVLVAEGTSTMHEAAALHTPLLLIPGPIQEATTLAERLSEEKAARMLKINKVSPDTVAAVVTEILSNPIATTMALERAAQLVTGGGGTDAAAKLVLEVAARRRSARSISANLRRPLLQEHRPCAS
ncbi:MAG: hypothetical protein JO267_01930 [Alphaproteobacteria bacterium]|nr:hypothetical protein [Alphaproteobacteria bacterium]MBV9860886.1 hypothetical protein [Alphaproteobacteria bacterium]